MHNKTLHFTIYFRVLLHIVFSSIFVYYNIINNTQMEEKEMTYRIITEEGKQILNSKTYEACERYWNACGGIYEDEHGEHYIYIEEVE